MSHERKENFGSYLKYNGVTTTPFSDDLLIDQTKDRYVLFPNNRVVMVPTNGGPIIYDLAKKEVIHQINGGGFLI